MSTDRILLVCGKEQRKALEEGLRDGGLEVLFAADVQQAFQDSLQLDPGLVLVDTGSVDAGFELLRRREAEPALRDLPIVLLTPEPQEADVVASMALGADDVVCRNGRLPELRARLQARLRSRNRIADLRSQGRDQEWLLDLSRTLASQLEVREILFTVASRLAEMVRVERVSFVIVSRDLEHGYVLAASEDRDAHNIRVALEKYPEIVEVVQNRRPLVVADVASDPLFADGMKEAIAKTEVRSLLLFPLICGEEVLGVLFLRARTRRDELTEREQRICRIVANATAVALKNAQIVQSIRGETQRSKLARLKAERKVRLLRRYEEFCEYASDGMAAVDADGKVLFLNPAGERILSRRRADVVGSTLTDLMTPRERQDPELLMRDLAASAPLRPFDLDIIAHDGHARTLSVSISALFGDEGAAVLSFRDVTEERALERDLRKTKEFLEGLVRQSVDAIVAADGTGRILLWNEAAEKLFGYTRAQALAGVRLDRLFPTGELQDLLRLVHSPERGGTGKLEPLRRDVLGQDGQRIAVRMSAGVIHLDEGDVPSALFAILSDLRPQQEMEARLTLTQEKLAETEKQAVVIELAGTAAHELNQPLTSLLGLAEMLRRTIDPERAERSAVEGVMREAERIAEIVRKLGRITRYETKGYVGDSKILDLDRSSKDG
jgi:PAS domain S-box-containing protein